jgi:F-type H+-transporting ATPase subunit delta
MTKVTVTSAVELSKAQLTELKTGLEKKHGKVTIETVVDPSLIGGLTVTVGSQDYNGSIAFKLSQVAKNLTEAASK